MSYINTVINKNRILNHSGLIRKKIYLLNSLKTDVELLLMAGHIELQLTDKCVLNCPNCHFRKMGDCEFLFAWLDNIGKFIKPKAITIAGGGEPTIYPRFNDVILKLIEIPKVQIGLITNGVVIPEGVWTRHVNWIRISVYTIEDGKYAGKKQELLDVVINNIQWYLIHTNIPNIGIHFLCYKSNASEIFSFTRHIYDRFKKDRNIFNRIHVQFKSAFIMARPTQVTEKLHEENINLLLGYEQLKNILAEFEKEFCKDKYFKSFVERQSNYELFSQLAKGELETLIGMTDIKKISVEKIGRCYVCLAYQLIAPDGYIYPCLTLAEHRIHDFSIGHISNMLDCRKKMKYFYTAPTECCNEVFCRNCSHNKIMEDYFKNVSELDIPKDNFF